MNLLTLKASCDNIMSKKREVKFMHVIFICTGNICRSAMADGYLKYRIKELGKEQDITVNSAGTHAIENQESPINAKKAIEKYGANINSHTATTLERANLEQATHILVMTDKHKKDVIARYPNVADKVKLLGEYSKDKKYKAEAPRRRACASMHEKGTKGGPKDLPKSSNASRKAQAGAIRPKDGNRARLHRKACLLSPTALPRAAFPPPRLPYPRCEMRRWREGGRAWQKACAFRSP